MLAYGQKKRGSHKSHPHNECGICSEISILKNTARKQGDQEIQEQILNSDPDFDDPMEIFGFCLCCDLFGCDYCTPEHGNQGDGWKLM